MKLIIYTDGSSKPNPGYTGFGIHGYIARVKEKRSVVKHPIQNKFYFTMEGYSTDKPEENIEVLEVIERSIMVEGQRETNNKGELGAVVWALENFVDQKEITHVKIYTDSTYVSKGLNDFLKTWRVCDWKRKDGQTIAHKQLWQSVDRLLTQYQQDDRVVEISWVKGHATDAGNNAAHLLSVVASTACEVNYNTNGSLGENLPAYSFNGTYKEYKKSYDNDDIIYHFKELVFSSNPCAGTTYCFLYNPPKEEIQAGKKTTETLFAINRGYFPEPVKKIIDYHRAIDRPYNAICSIKLNRLKDKELLRLLESCPFSYLVRKSKDGMNNYVYVGTPATLVCDKEPQYALTYQWYTKFEFLYDATDGNLDELTTPGSIEYQELDISDLLMNEKGNIKLTNKSSKVCVNGDSDSPESMTEQHKEMIGHIRNKLELYVGKDLPSFIAMKRMEADLQKVTLVVVYNFVENTASCITQFHLSNRVISLTNLLDKFILKAIK